MGMTTPSAIAAWNVIIIRTYYHSTIPDELHEAAQLDGCSDMRFLMSVVVQKYFVTGVMIGSIRG